MTLVDHELSPEGVRLVEIAGALDLHPGLAQMERAMIFEVITTLPGKDKPYDYRANYARGWRFVRGISLGFERSTGPFPRSVTLEIASSYNDSPLPGDVIAALRRAAEMIA